MQIANSTLESDLYLGRHDFSEAGEGLPVHGRLARADGSDLRKSCEFRAPRHRHGRDARDTWRYLALGSAETIVRAVPIARRGAARGLGTAIVLAFIVVMSLAAPASGKPSQRDVFRSIENNVSHSEGSGVRWQPWACAGAGVIILMAIFSHRQTRDASPKPLNNHAKLIKEVMKTLPLKPRELKQLKVAAEEKTTPSGQPLCSPLVLLLSPSALSETVQKRSSRADRQVLARVIRRLG